MVNNKKNTRDHSMVSEVERERNDFQVIAGRGDFDNDDDRLVLANHHS